MSVRWILALIMFFMICTLISNIIEGQATFTSEQIADLNAMHEQTLSESKEPNVGGVVSTGMNPIGVLTAIWKSLTMEYSFLYDVNYSMTEADCSAVSNARWNATAGACQTPNVWMMPFMIMIWGPIVAVAFFLVLTIWHGGG